MDLVWLLRVLQLIDLGQDTLSLQYSTYGGGDVAETNIANIFEASFSTLCDCFLSNNPHTQEERAITVRRFPYFRTSYRNRFNCSAQASLVS